MPEPQINEIESKRRTTKRDQQRPGRRDHQGARKEGSPRSQGGGTTKEPGKRDYQAREEGPPSQGGGTTKPGRRNHQATKEPGKRDHQGAREEGLPRSRGGGTTKEPGKMDQGAGRRDHQGAREEGPGSQGGGTTKDGQEEYHEVAAIVDRYLSTKVTLVGSYIPASDLLCAWGTEFGFVAPVAALGYIALCSSM
ncbi:hypothetical protein BDR07DRAFT_1459743 [Suillus spraguei]|nr:hypothetical protein BDR07DRAFT_1459743 [Suillus spraguei]